MPAFARASPGILSPRRSCRTNNIDRPGLLGSAAIVRAISSSLEILIRLVIGDRGVRDGLRGRACSRSKSSSASCRADARKQLRRRQALQDLRHWCFHASPMVALTKRLLTKQRSEQCDSRSNYRYPKATSSMPIRKPCCVCKNILIASPLSHDQGGPVSLRS